MAYFQHDFQRDSIRECHATMTSGMLMVALPTETSPRDLCVWDHGLSRGTDDNHAM